MQMFRFLGQMIGGAIRGKTAIPLDLAPSLWKAILGEELSIQDLKETDTFSWQVLDGLKNEAEKLSDEEFEAVIDQSFTTLLSDGSEVQLKQNGANIKVTKENY